MKTDGQLTPNISWKKNDKKRYSKKNQNNEAVHYVYNKFLKKIYNLPMNFRFFNFSARYNTFFTACTVSIYLSLAELYYELVDKS